MMVNIKDVTFKLSHLIAYGTMTVPGTLQTPEMYAISLWIKDIAEPIIVTYETIDERNTHISTIETAYEESDYSYIGTV